MRNSYRNRLAWRRRVKHGAQIAAFLLRISAACCFLGLLGAVGGIEVGGSIREGMKLVLMWSVAGGFCLLAGEVIDRVVSL